MKFYKLTASAIALAGLTACGGGGGGTAPLTISPTDPGSSVDAVDAQIASVFNSDGFTAASEMPTSGSATYTGIVGVEWTGATTGTQYADIGTANFSANFNTSSMTMTSENFAEYTVVGTTSDGFDSSDFAFNQSLTGSLTMTDGVIGVDSFNDGNFTGTMSGTISTTSGAGNTYGASVEGFFVGDNAQAITGGSTSGSDIFFGALQ